MRLNNPAMLLCSTLLPILLVPILLATAAPAAEPAALEVSTWKGGGGEIANVPALVAKFEQQNPDIRVKLEYMTRVDTATVIPTRLQGGSAPDVMMVDRQLMGQWGAAGQLMDLRHEPWVDTVDPKLRQYMEPSGTHGGAVYMLPLEVVGMGLFANTDLLAKAGIDHVPTTAAELKADCGRLHAAGITPMLVPAKDGWGPGMWATTWTLAPGIGQPTPLDEKFVTGQAKFADDLGANAALHGLAELADAKCFDPKLNVGVDTWSIALSEFKAGHVAMEAQGAWNIQRFSANKKLRFVFAPLPSLAGGDGVGMDLVGSSWAVNAATKNAVAAKRWMAFWSRDENLSQFLLAESAFTPLQAGSTVMPANAQLYTDAHRAGHVIISPDGTWKQKLIDAMQHSLTAYFLDIRQDPKPILARWDAAAG